MVKANQMVFRKAKYIGLFLCLLCGLQTIAQVSAPAPAGAPAPTSLPANLPANLPQGTIPGTNTPASNQGQQSGNNPTQQQGQNTAENAPSSDESPLDGDKAKLKDEASGTLNGPSAERQALLNRIFGYSLFSTAKFTPIQDQQIATPSGYVVGPGDVLDINVYGETQQAFTNLKVNRDGYVVLPRIGNVYVLGKNVNEITKLMIGKLSRFNPSILGQEGDRAASTVKVTLSEVRSVQIYVTGEAMYPASYSLSSLSTVFNALYLAGGPNELGTYRDVKVIRNNQVVARIDIYDYLINGMIKNDIFVQDNDNISIGYRLSRVEILGRIKRPGLFEMKPGEKLSDLIRFAGGFEDDAYKAQFKVLRFTSRERKIIDVTEDQISSFELQSGDVINIEPILDRFENIVTIEGAVMRPGDYSLDNNPTLKKLLESAQGLREDAFGGRIYVSRTRPDQTVENLSFNLGDILTGKVTDLQLTRLDVVTIPSKFSMAEQAVVSITGEVNNRSFGDNGGSFPYVANMTLEDLILKADGLKESADVRNIQITRRKRDVEAKQADAQIAEVFTVSLGRDLSINGNQSNVILWPYDEVIVRKSPSYQEQKYVRVEGDGILREGAYPILNRNDKISDIIARAGGLTELAYLPGATLIRTTVDPNADAQVITETQKEINNDVLFGTVAVKAEAAKQQNIGINMEKIIKNTGSREDLIVQEGDVIRIPKRLETVQVFGEVLYPTTVKYNDGMGFLDFVSQSGGYTKQSLRRSAWIRYPNGSVDRTRRFLAFNIYPKVEPGSEIFVPVKAANALNPVQMMQFGIQITSTLMTLILSVLAFRNF